MKEQKKYRFLNNFIYALNISRKSNLKLLEIILIKPVADIVCKLLWSYAPKFVLSYIENNLAIDKIIFNILVICKPDFQCYWYDKL